MKFLRQSWLTCLCLTFFSHPSFILSQENKPAGPYLVYTVTSGMFATFSAVLGTLQVYETGHFAGLKIDLNNGVYLDPEKGSNWWDYFFEPICLGDESASHYICSLDDHIQLAPIGFGLSREEGHRLINKYIHLKPEIKDEIDHFVDKNFSNQFVIGVHHRGTDKVTESALIPYQKTCHALKSLMLNLPEESRSLVKIYVATDDDHFLQYIIDHYSHQVVYNEFVRSTDHTPLHHGETEKYQNNYQKGKEALIDCLLLSRCDCLIRPTSSCLSAMAEFFNPNSHVIRLSE